MAHKYELRQKELVATRLVQSEVKANKAEDLYGYVPT